MKHLPSWYNRSLLGGSKGGFRVYYILNKYMQANLCTRRHNKANTPTHRCHTSIPNSGTYYSRTCEYFNSESLRFQVIVLSLYGTFIQLPHKETCQPRLEGEVDGECRNFLPDRTMIIALINPDLLTLHSQSSVCPQLGTCKLDKRALWLRAVIRVIVGLPITGLLFELQLQRRDCKHMIHKSLSRLFFNLLSTLVSGIMQVPNWDTAHLRTQGNFLVFFGNF